MPMGSFFIQGACRLRTRFKYSGNVGAGCHSENTLTMQVSGALLGKQYLPWESTIFQWEMTVLGSLGAVKVMAISICPLGEVSGSG